RSVAAVSTCARLASALLTCARLASALLTCRSLASALLTCARLASEELMLTPMPTTATSSWPSEARSARMRATLRPSGSASCGDVEVVHNPVGRQGLERLDKTGAGHLNGNVSGTCPLRGY